MGRVWQGISLPEGVEIKENGGTPAVGIRFRYRGVRCRELSLPIQDPRQAKRYIATVADKLATIRLEIELGTFRYGNHFPESPRCKIFGEGETKTRTIKQALRDWLDAFEKTSESSTFAANKRLVENLLIPKIGSKLVVGFTAIHAAELITELGQCRVGHSVRNAMLPLRGAFDRELMARTIEINPLRQIRINQHLPPASRKHQTPLPQPFNEAERNAILAVAVEQMRNMCAVWWGSGMAEGEILALQWQDLDFVNGTICLSRIMDMVGNLRERMKTVTRHRTLPMTPELRAILIAQKKFTFIEGKDVFVNPVTGKRWASGKALTNNQWRTLLKRAGVRYRNPNQCRHTYAAIRITRGDNLWEIAEALGHRGPQMLYKHYGSIIKEASPTGRGARYGMVP